MPNVFKPTYTDKRTGKTKSVKYYYTRINGRRFSLRVTDKRVAERKASELLRLFEEGHDPDRIRQARSASITSHFDAFELSLNAKGCCIEHIKLLKTRLEKIFAECSVCSLADVSVAEFENWLARQQADGNIGAQTRKHYASHLRQFGGFLVSRELVPKNPFLAVRTDINVESDRKLKRRALTADEIRKLLASVSESKRRRCKLSGPERRLLYWLASVTGLRRNELGTLTRESFALDAKPPTVSVVASRTKNRKTATLPIRSDLAAELEPWLATKSSDDVLFPISNRPTNLMIRDDLLDAGIEPVKLGKQCDFHALRVTMVSHLALNGVPLAIAQKLARHSTPVLTANQYTQLGMTELKQAVEALPSLGISDADDGDQLKSGNDGVEQGDTEKPTPRIDGLDDATAKKPT